MKFGLGKGLGALIPNSEPPQDIEKENPRKNEPESALDWDDELQQIEEQDEVKVSVSEDPDDEDQEDYEQKSAVQQYEEVDEKVTDKDEIREIPIDEIVPNPFQPRKIFKPAALQELADSIREHGIIQPLVVTQRDDGIYELLAGERRLQASKLVGLDVVPAVVRARKITDSDKLEMALIENLQREDLNIIETARAYQRLHDDFNMTYEQVAQKVGMSRSGVNNIVRLLQLPVDFQRALMDGKIVEGHGRALLQVADRERQYVLYEMILKKGISTDQAFEIAKQWTARPHLRKDTSHIRFTPETKALESVIKKGTGIKHVKVKLHGQGGGKVEIQFLNEDEYNQLMEKFNNLA